MMLILTEGVKLFVPDHVIIAHLGRDVIQHHSLLYCGVVKANKRVCIRRIGGH